jgi:hypothetical protein
MTDHQNTTELRNIEVKKTLKMIARPRTFLEKQQFFLAHSVGLTFFSPLACCYHVLKLNPQVQVSFRNLIPMVARIFPSQVGLRMILTNVCTPIKENLNSWAAFGMIGILQGAVYGHANIYFASQFGILQKSASYANVLRGSRFAAGRDMISQGVPFMLSDTLRKKVFDRFHSAEDGNKFPEFFVRFAPTLCLSIVSTYASQALHTCQTTMQITPNLDYASVWNVVWKANRWAVFYKGAEARVGLLIIINVLNEILLKPAWGTVEVAENL